jgi:GWxTD domain-containing protein
LRCPESAFGFPLRLYRCPRGALTECLNHGCASAALLAFLFCPILAVAQDQPAPPDNSAKPLRDKDKDVKKRQNKLAKELSLDDSNWLLNEVPDIITDAERRAFLELGTEEEREQFREQFWRDRNPEPDSQVNTVREEHYRRRAYADGHFASGIPGRKTDRGHIYIMWGPPDEIESHPTGGTYDRPMEQGGGSTTTYPWELWRYRHLEGIGENIEIEFVDPTLQAPANTT